MVWTEISDHQLLRGMQTAVLNQIAGVRFAASMSWLSALSSVLCEELQISLHWSVLTITCVDASCRT